LWKQPVEQAEAVQRAPAADALKWRWRAAADCRRAAGVGHPAATVTGQRQSCDGCQRPVGIRPTAGPVGRILAGEPRLEWLEPPAGARPTPQGTKELAAQCRWRWMNRCATALALPELERLQCGVRPWRAIPGPCWPSSRPCKPQADAQHRIRKNRHRPALHSTNLAACSNEAPPHRAAAWPPAGGRPGGGPVQRAIPSRCAAAAWPRGASGMTCLGAIADDAAEDWPTTRRRADRRLERLWAAGAGGGSGGARGAGSSCGSCSIGPANRCGTGGRRVVIGSGGSKRAGRRLVLQRSAILPPIGRRHWGMAAASGEIDSGPATVVVNHLPLHHVSASACRCCVSRHWAYRCAG